MKTRKVGPLGPLFFPFYILCSLAAGLAAAAPARAAEPAWVSFNSGPIEIFDTDTRAQLGAELRFPPPVPLVPPFPARPLAGRRGPCSPPRARSTSTPAYAATCRSGGAGSCQPAVRDRRSTATARGSTSAGRWSSAPASRSRARSARRRRVGLALFHLSNAHLYAHNPGTEGLVLTYSVRP